MHAELCQGRHHRQGEGELEPPPTPELCRCLGTEPPRATPLTPVSPQVGRLHGSVPNLSRYLESSQSQLPFSLPPEYCQLQRSFWVLAQKGGMGRGVEP